MLCPETYSWPFGTHVDGHHFIAQAIQNGAEYIVCQKNVDCKQAKVILVTDSAYALGLLAQAAQGDPNAKLTNLAVTGTNGKTTTSFLVRSVVEQAGFKSGLIEPSLPRRPAFCGIRNDHAGPDYHRPEPPRHGGRWAKFMIIEASSHALDQKRLAGINFTAAAFTNLTGDQLDYIDHGQYLRPRQTFLLIADPCHRHFKCSIRNSQKNCREMSCTHFVVFRSGTRRYLCEIESMNTAAVNSRSSLTIIRKSFYSPPGRHNISNHLAAAGLV
jgi:UDP-N-acetylmuramyl tripeptide synthase